MPEGFITPYITCEKTVPAYAGSADEDGWLWTIELKAFIGRDESSHVEVGSLVAYKSDFNAFWRDGQSLFDAFDQYSSELALMALTIMDTEGDWRPYLYSQFDLVYADVLYIDRVKVSPMLRGRKLGLALVERCIAFEASGCGLVVLDPLPEQYYYDHVTNEPKDLNRSDIQEAIKRIGKYFSQLGFKRIRGSRFLGLDPARRQPSPKKLV